MRKRGHLYRTQPSHSTQVREAQVELVRARNQLDQVRGITRFETLTMTSADTLVIGTHTTQATTELDPTNADHRELQRHIERLEQRTSDTAVKVALRLDLLPNTQPEYVELLPDLRARTARIKRDILAQLAWSAWTHLQTKPIPILSNLVTVRTFTNTDPPQALMPTKPAYRGTSWVMAWVRYGQAMRSIVTLYA